MSNTIFNFPELAKDNVYQTLFTNVELGIEGNAKLDTVNLEKPFTDFVPQYEGTNWVSHKLWALPCTVGSVAMALYHLFRATFSSGALYISASYMKKAGGWLTTLVSDVNGQWRVQKGDFEIAFYNHHLAGTLPKSVDPKPQSNPSEATRKPTTKPEESTKPDPKEVNKPLEKPVEQPKKIVLAQMPIGEVRNLSNEEFNSCEATDIIAFANSKQAAASQVFWKKISPEKIKSKEITLDQLSKGVIDDLKSLICHPEYPALIELFSHFAPEDVCLGAYTKGCLLRYDILSKAQLEAVPLHRLTFEQIHHLFFLSDYNHEKVKAAFAHVQVSEAHTATCLYTELPFLPLFSDKQLETFKISNFTILQLEKLLSFKEHELGKFKRMFAKFPNDEVQKVLEKCYDTKLCQNISRLMSPTHWNVLDFTRFPQWVINALFPLSDDESVKNDNLFVKDPNKLKEIATGIKYKNEVVLKVLTEKQLKVLEPMLYKALTPEQKMARLNLRKQDRGQG